MVMPSSSDVEISHCADHKEVFSEPLILEPLPLSMLPPEPEITDEEFEKEVDLMMMDTDSMYAEPSDAHGLFVGFLSKMKFLCWNINVCCSDRKWLHVLNLYRKFRYDAICLIETMVDEETVRKYVHNLPFDVWFVITSVGKSGGLDLGYFEKSNIEIINSSFNMIHLVCDITPRIKNCLISFVYGSLNNLGLRTQWNLLSSINNEINRTWLLLGDFNFIMHDSEKLGGNIENSIVPNFLRNKMIELNLNEVYSFGNPYTWCNRRFKVHAELIFEKLDRGFINDKWISLLPHTRVTNLGRVYSDHCPVLLNYFHFKDKLSIPYKFFRCWQMSPDFKNVLINSWSKSVKGSSSFIAASKLKNLKHDLSNWNRNSFGHIKTTIGKLNAEIEKLQSLPYNPTIGSFILNYSKQLDYWYEVENSFYKQKSRIDYFNYYDKNTNFFHNTVKLGNMYILYTLYVTVMPNNSVIEEVLKDIQPIITNDVNTRLTAIPTSGEILDTVRNMAPWKSPGPDGFPGGFFRENWNEVSLEVINHVQSFFRTKFFLKQLNHTFIALIPKVNNPTSPHDFRPISLTNTIYNIISKILTNRLKPLLDTIISPFQSAFIANRQIQDNILISHEILHSFKTRKRNNNKNGFMAIKLDLSKAFDRLECPFIIVVFKKLGFSEDWCHLIFQCISSVSYSVLVNGSPSDIFYPYRGIRQGDFLSPYIFILCMETLSQLLLKGEKDNLIQGFKLRNHSPSISHLFFADNCMLFMKASLTYVRNLMKIIDSFAQASAVYHISSFPFPKMITAKIDSIQRTFWWSKKYPRRAAYYRSWGDIGKSKLNGGLGIKNSFATNRVFIAKIGWRLYKNPDHLVSKFFKDKYYPNQNMLEIDKAVDSASWTWKGIVKGLTFIKANIVYKINDDKTTRIWTSNWLPFSDSPPNSMNPNFVSYSFVSDLIDVQSNSWNISLITSLFSHDVVNKILALRINTSKQDTIMWAHTRNESFTIKSAFKVYMNKSIAPEDAFFWKKVWSLNCLPKIKCFMWKIFAYMLPVNSLLVLYNPAADDCCSLCKNESETVMHLFFKCPMVVHIWFPLSLQHMVAGNFDWVDDTFMNWFDNNLGTSPFIVDWPSIGAIVMWSIWKFRCDVIFKNSTISLDKVILDTRRMINTFIAPPSPSVNYLSEEIVKTPLQNVDYVIFLDGSYKDLNMDIGIVLCDNAGRVIQARADFGLITGDVGAEATSLFLSISWAEEMNLSKVLFVSDCLQLVKFIQDGKDVVDWLCSDLLEDCRISISNITSFRVVHIKRLKNKAVLNRPPTLVNEDAYMVWVEEESMLTSQNLVRQYISAFLNYNKVISLRRDPHALYLLSFSSRRAEGTERSPKQVERKEIRKIDSKAAKSSENIVSVDLKMIWYN
ncbi:uncharacterized protein LOC113279597 [Papaver somniferum]|uniref:uncharacterized protein LOC113279597 n=1 Tax=Papaver somniferum TaxID=3469 RepID=UPI000E6F7F08|nr:uncharacterized protein LOC113279597 [Papaver somniferum]